MLHLLLCSLVFPSMVAAPQASDFDAKEIALDLGGGVKLDLVRIPAGSFLMGEKDDRDAKPAHKVMIKTPFYLGKYEVTQEQWKAIMGADHAATTNKGAKHPTDTVEWWECQALCAKLNARFKDKAFRLPSEAEWEYACRAGSTTKYHFGDDPAQLSEYAWHRRDDDRTPNPKVKGIADSHPVGLKKPNAWGLYDIHGNVWEWCHTGWKEYPYDADDGREKTIVKTMVVPKDRKSLVDARVLRGGSWHHGAKAATSFHRAASRPAEHRYYYGCRVALSIP